MTEEGNRVFTGVPRKEGRPRRIERRRESEASIGRKGGGSHSGKRIGGAIWLTYGKEDVHIPTHHRSPGNVVAFSCREAEKSSLIE